MINARKSLVILANHTSIVDTLECILANIKAGKIDPHVMKFTPESPAMFGTVNLNFVGEVDESLRLPKTLEILIACKSDYEYIAGLDIEHIAGLKDWLKTRAYAIGALTPNTQEQDGPGVEDGHDWEGFPGGCARFNCGPNCSKHNPGGKKAWREPISQDDKTKAQVAAVLLSKNLDAPDP